MYERILVPFDGSATSRKGLEEALKLARLTGAKVRVVHVLEMLHFVTGFEPGSVFVHDALPHMHEAAEKILARAERLAAASGIGIETLLLEGMATRVSALVVEQAKIWNADLIVIGTHGRHGVNRWMLGSDAEQIVRMASIPVLLVRAPEEAPALPAAA